VADASKPEQLFASSKHALAAGPAVRGELLWTLKGPQRLSGELPRTPHAGCVRAVSRQPTPEAATLGSRRDERRAHCL